LESVFLESPGSNPQVRDWSAPVDPERALEFSAFRVGHRFDMIGFRRVRWKDCAVIEVRPAGLPKGVRDDTEGAPLWTLCLRKADGTVARYSWALRGGPCFTTGKLQQQGTCDCTKHQPKIIPLDQQCPLDVPLLTAVGLPVRFLWEKDKKISYTDERTGQKQMQTIAVIDDVVFGKRQKVVYVTLQGKDWGLRTQRWVSGYPWWLTWSRTMLDGRLEYGLLRSRLVQYGSEGGKPQTVAAPEW